MHIIDVAVLYPHCPIGLDRHHQKDTDSLRCARVCQGLSSHFCVCVYSLPITVPFLLVFLHESVA